MSHIRLLVIGDVHISDHPPGQRVEGYREHILDKLYECVEIAKTREATHVLFLGDIFHLKSASRVSHRLVQDVANLMTSFGLPVSILVGNHDITSGTLDTLTKQPIGILQFLPNVDLLTTEPYSLADDVLVHPVPGVTGVTMDTYAIKKANKADIMAVHQSIVPDIGLEPEMLKDILFDAKAVSEVTDIDTILYGHQHRCDGVYSITRDNGSTATFSNLGSICRLTVTENDLNKVPAVLLLDITDDRDVTTEVVNLTKILPAHEAYRLEEHIENKEHNKDIEETIKKLRETEVSAFSIEGVIKDVEERGDIDARVRDTALDLLEEVK